MWAVIKEFFSSELATRGTAFAQDMKAFSDLEEKRVTKRISKKQYVIILIAIIADVISWLTPTGFIVCEAIAYANLIKFFITKRNSIKKAIKEQMRKYEEARETRYGRETQELTDKLFEKNLQVNSMQISDKEKEVRIKRNDRWFQAELKKLQEKYFSVTTQMPYAQCGIRL